MLVDVGCDPGAAAREASRHGAAVTGVDPDPLMLLLARTITAVKGGTSPADLNGAGVRHTPDWPEALTVTEDHALHRT